MVATKSLYSVKVFGEYIGPPDWFTTDKVYDLSVVASNIEQALAIAYNRFKDSDNRKYSIKSIKLDRGVVYL